MNHMPDPSPTSAGIAGHGSAAADIDHDATGLIAVDLDAIVANWRNLASRAVPAECAAVVKADAYGCGLKPVTRALADAGCKTFFVATLDEARAARQCAPSATIYVLDGFFAGCGDIYAAHELRPVIGDATELAEWDGFRTTKGWHGDSDNPNKGKFAIHADTGMNRLGFPLMEARALAPRLDRPYHGVELVMSHFACSETPAHALNARQIADFRELAHQFPGVSASLANSSGIFLGTQACFDLVRPGAALYGVNPTPGSDNPMRAVVTVKTRVLQIRHVEKGASVGYGATWNARRPSRLAIVSAGYADGYHRAASAADGVRGADAIVAGKRCPIAGRISMDLMAIDITDVPADSVRRGHLVTLIGDGLSVDDLAQPFGTIGYEVLTSLSRRFQRIYRTAG